MQKTRIFIAALAVALLAAGCNQANDNQNTNNSSNTNTEAMSSNATNTNDSMSNSYNANRAMTGETKTFTVNGNNFAFSPSEIRVKQGDTVKIEFKNTGGFHDWVLDEFNARTKQLPDGQSETITFVADKKGTFEFYCSVGKHREMGMKGNLIVE